MVSSIPILFTQNYLPLTGNTILSQSGPGSNGNEGVLLIPQSSKTEASPPNATLYHILET